VEGESAPSYGRLRPVIPDVVHKFLACGDLARGFARIRCDHCKHEYLLAFSCKSRWFCPSCHQKNVQATARYILDQVLAPVPHRHYVLAIPRMLRPYFQRHRYLLKRLCALAHESLAEYLRTAVQCPEGVPGIILTLHTFGEYLDFHPHVHALVADGLFIKPSENSGAAQAQTLNSHPSALNFLPLPETPLKPLEELFRAKIIHLLVEQRLLPPERVQVLYSWKHSGFNLNSALRAPHSAYK
jgi:Transposase zinc-binding domain/Putative transposase